MHQADLVVRSHPMTVRGGDDERRQRVVDCLAGHTNDGASLGDALCATSVEILDLAGAGLNLHSSSGTPHSFGACGPAMATIHDLERTLGEGPCIDAYNDEVPTDEPDLLASGSARWPAFRTEALETGARAVFGYPLMFGDVCFGALNLYATEAGALARDQHLDALVLADVSIRSVMTTGDGSLAVDFADHIEALVRDQGVVHQATGMVSAQLGVPVDDASAILRARAFADGRPLTEVADDVTERRIRFAP